MLTISQQGINVKILLTFLLTLNFAFAQNRCEKVAETKKLAQELIESKALRLIDDGYVYHDEIILASAGTGVALAASGKLMDRHSNYNKRYKNYFKKSKAPKSRSFLKLIKKNKYLVIFSLAAGVIINATFNDKNKNESTGNLEKRPQDILAIKDLFDLKDICTKVSNNNAWKALLKLNQELRYAKKMQADIFSKDDKKKISDSFRFLIKEESYKKYRTLIRNKASKE